jgi:hypothetical protein
MIEEASIAPGRVGLLEPIMALARAKVRASSARVAASIPTATA